MPSTTAIPVAPAASTELQGVADILVVLATENHFVLKLSMGQPCVTLSLNAYRPITTSGT